VHDTTSAQAQPTGRAPIGHDPSSTMPGAPIPVRALSLSPRHFDDKEESPISSQVGNRETRKRARRGLAADARRKSS
jgi:hypothetical protein